MPTYLYKSKTGQTVNIYDHIVTVHPGLEFPAPNAILDAYIGVILERFTDGEEDATATSDFVTAQVDAVSGGIELSAGNTKLALNGTTKDTFVLIGDSRNWSSYAWDDATYASRFLGSGSTIAWLQYISKVQFECRGVAAKSGAHLNDPLTYWDSPNAMTGFAANYGLGDVDLTQVKWAFVMLGVNDLPFWVPGYFDAIDGIIVKLAAVENIVWIGESAVGAGALGWGASYPAKRNALNNYLKTKAAGNPKLTFIDLETESLDAVSATGLASTDYIMNTDMSGNTVASIHPTSRYHRKIAAKVWAAIAPKCNTWADPLAKGIRDTYLTTPESNNAFPNSMLTTTAAASGTGISGTLPANCTATIVGAGTTVVCSVIDDAFGKAAVFDITHATPGTTCGVTVAFTGLGTDLINCGNPTKTQWLIDASFGKTGAGALDLLPFVADNGAKPIGGMYRVKRSGFRTAYMLDHSSTAADKSNIDLKHIDVFEGVMSSPELDTSALTGPYVAGAANSYANVTGTWKADGTGAARLILRRPTVRFTA